MWKGLRFLLEQSRRKAEAGWLSGLQATAWFKSRRKAEAELLTNLRCAGYFFTATRQEASALDLIRGPKAAALVSQDELPHLYEPTFLDLVVAATLDDPHATGLEVSRRDGDIVLYVVPALVTAALSHLTPDKPDSTLFTIESITDRLMLRNEVTAQYKRGGVSSAVLILRGYALDAGPRTGKELYYWFWRNPEYSKQRSR